VAAQARPAKQPPRLSVEAQAVRTPQRGPEAEAAAAELDRKIKLGIVIGSAVIMLAALILGSLPTKIVVSLICLVTLQGLWRGAAELVGLVVSTIFAVALAPALGRGFEGLFRGLFGTTGVLNRTISIAVVGLLIIVAGTTLLSIGARRFVKQRPELARVNKYAGAGMGLVEGTILGMAVLWTVLALEPIAAGQLTSQPSYVVPDEGDKANPVAKGLVSFADKVRDSALGGMAQATNPIEGARLLSLCNDFVAVARDEAAFDSFMQSPVMQEIKELPSMQAAMDRVKADPELANLVKDDLTADAVRTVLGSKTILDIFDHTTVVSDLTPRMDALIQAIAEAKAKIGAVPKDPPIPKRRK
jgi:hypothetical protein